MSRPHFHHTPGALVALRIGIDVDEVVAQLHKAWLWRYNSVYGDDLKPEDITDWSIEKFVDRKCGRSIFHYLTPDLYEAIDPYPGAWEVVNQLRSLGSIYFVSNSRNQAMTDAKIAWLMRHGFLAPDEGWRFIPTVESKSAAPVDILIDDHVVNVNEFPGWALLLNRPHNLTAKTPRTRLHRFSDALPLIRGITLPCKCANG